jgi:hypothetical protein
MDTEDRDHFKTIASQLPKQLADWPKQPSEEISVLTQSPAYCLNRAKLLFSCYRKDEAHEPEVYAAAVGAVLSGYAREVVDRATDPRSGIAAKQKWLPSIAEVTEFCDALAKRVDTIAKPPRRVVHYEPPPVLPGQETYPQFLARCERDGLEPRPIGRFEQGEQPKAERSGQTEKEKEQLREIIQRANEIFLRREYEAARKKLNSQLSLSLRKRIEKQNEERQD